ncbi:RHTO0S26e00716g1_1 [Rhodotorula toruloides]|uniref:RHTO0S26e00716g1_1 n=2 Tax=Rhodotorula toruloides TaxID=5286 RepID=A0A061BHB9_RHOTO|nr:RHTO0S26e00716g1_1 [Rhodotorula toruloides]
MSPRQEEDVVAYLERLAGRIEEGRFDARRELPPFSKVAVDLGVYLGSTRSEEDEFGLSARLQAHAVKKAKNWGFSSRARLVPYYSQSQHVPILTQFSVRSVEKALLSVHAGVEREGINLEAFKAWGRTWWMRLFAAHADKAYLALWYCLAEAERGEAIDFFVHCGLRLLSEREQALLPFENSPLAQELRDPQAARALSARRTLRSSIATSSLLSLVTRADLPRLAVLAAFEQGAVIKTGNEGYDRWPDMPEFLQSSANSLGTSLLHNYSHRQRAIYPI